MGSLLLDTRILDDTRPALEFVFDFFPELLGRIAAGLEAADGKTVRHLRRRERAPGGPVPAVAVTAFASDADRQRAFDAGFQRHVAKPVDPSELVTVIRGLLAEVRATARD